MPGDDLVTRDELGRELAVNAATKPVNLAALFGIGVVGVVLGVPLVAAVVALVVYLLLCWQTFADGEEAERVGRAVYARRRPARARLDTAALPPDIAAPLRTAREQAAGIREAILSSGGAMHDVAADVDALVAAMDTSAARAATIHRTLAELAAAGDDPERLGRRIEQLRPRAGDPDVAALVEDLEAQLSASRRLHAKLERFTVGQQRICSALGLLRTRIAEMSAAEEEAAQRELTAQARDLRERTDLLADSLAEVFAEPLQSPGVADRHPGVGKADT